MSKTILILLSIGLFSFNAFSQVEGTIDVTGTWSTHIKTPGINVRAYFFANDKICFGPELTYFFEKNTGENTINTFAMDFNGHYVFETLNHHLGIYPILGLNFTREKEVENISGESHIQNAFGVNIGGGLETPITHRINLFSEFIHTFSELEDSVFYLGFNYRW